MFVHGIDRLGLRYVMPVGYNIVRVRFGSNFHTTALNTYVGLHIDGVEVATAEFQDLKEVEFPYTPGQELYIFEVNSWMRHELVIQFGRRNLIYVWLVCQAPSKTPQPMSCACRARRARHRRTRARALRSARTARRSFLPLLRKACCAKRVRRTLWRLSEVSA